VIAARYSCRDFSDEPVADDVLSAILTAGLHAPSAINKQPWRIIAVRDRALLDDIEAAGLAALGPDDAARITSRGGKMMYNANVMVVIAGQQVNSPYPDTDCGIVASHIALAAASLGVNSCIAAMPGHALVGEGGPALRSRMGMPDGFHFTISVLLGHAAGAPHAGHDIDPSKATIV